MSNYSGFINPSLYSILINAKECGWVPRPPSIPLNDTDTVIGQLQKYSSKVSDKAKLDLHFAASLHERKHFMDMHLSPVFFGSFLKRFYCYSQIFAIIPLLKGKKISIPLYTPLGTLKDQNSFSESEKDMINNICSTIFTDIIHPRFYNIMETSATLLQYSVLHDYYDEIELNELYPSQYYKKYYIEPIDKFSGDHNRAFCSFCFIAWFCQDVEEIDIIENHFLQNSDYKQVLNNLLQKSYLSQKNKEIIQDFTYLEKFSQNYKKPNSKYFPDFRYFLSEILSFRKRLFESKDMIISLLTDTSFFCDWITKYALKTYYLVDFGKPLPLDTEITENYHASKWIVENQQYLYYDDNLGKQFLSFEELDNIINIQMLSSSLINPIQSFDFKTKIASQEFLECEFI